MFVEKMYHISVQFTIARIVYICTEIRYNLL